MRRKCANLDRRDDENEDFMCCVRCSCRPTICIAMVRR